MRSSAERPQASEDYLVEAARRGDRAALEALVAQIQGRIYNLAVRMLWHPADAEDATQEILIKIVTHLSDFRRGSRFSTWTWRIAVNHVLTTRKRQVEQQARSFAEFAQDLEQGLAETIPDASAAVDERLLLEEVKIGCMQGMLLCLSREERAAYVLGEIFQVTDREAAEIFGISAAACRKRLSRARAALRGFMQRKCGLVEPTNPCRCRRRVKTAIEQRRLNPARLLFAQSGADAAVVRGVAEMDALDRAAALFRSHPDYPAPATFVHTVRALFASGQLSFLDWGSG
ncbi:MAG: RNA polymerase sigma factor [Chloroflexi bacterium]|nr:RNA polymerase sigma factor [Chloroflexota bacterium]